MIHPSYDHDEYVVFTFPSVMDFAVSKKSSMCEVKLSNSGMMN